MGFVYKQSSISEKHKMERWRYAMAPADEMTWVLKRNNSLMKSCSKKENSFELKVGLSAQFKVAIVNAQRFLFET